MAKKLENGGTVKVNVPAIIGDDGGPECIIPNEKIEKTKELICKATEALTITNGDKLLFHGKGVESITINFRGD